MPVNGKSRSDYNLRFLSVKDIRICSEHGNHLVDTDDTGVQYGYDTQDWQLNVAATDGTGDSYFDFGTDGCASPLFN